MQIQTTPLRNSPAPEINALAFAALATDPRLFRALVSEAETGLGMDFGRAAAERIATEINAALRQTGAAADEDFFTPGAVGASVAFLKNRNGAIIKLINVNGLVGVDAYYSYPAGKKRQKLPARVTSSPVWKKASAKTARSRNARRRLYAAQIVCTALSFLIGMTIVQAVFYLVIGRFGVDYASVFGSLALGFILYASAGETILHLCVKNYDERQAFGDGDAPPTLFLIAIFMDAALHAAIYAFMPHTIFNTLVICASVLFFIYPGTFFAQTFWNMKRGVVAINTGKKLINRRHYANMPISAPTADMLPVTISIAVYTEENSVIFDNIAGCVRATTDYEKTCGKQANIVVSDDGLPRLLGGDLNRAFIDELIAIYKIDPQSLTNERRQGVERVLFFRKNNVAFVSRPSEGRAGKFKKGGNLNFSYRLARGEETGGYAEGPILFHDVILTLDKDSVVQTGVLQAAIPEFLRDPKLAYAQSVTVAANPNGNYFSRIMCQYFYVLQNTSLPTKSLQGLITPLMGHNVFIRRSFLEETGGWPEDRVSEDFATSIDAHLCGYHGKYIAFKGLEFGEYVCDTFAEETGKQLRYCYGLLEILTRSFHRIRRLSVPHWLDIGSYFFSQVNIAAIIPTFLIMLRYDIFYLVFGGIIVNSIIYFLLQLALYVRMRRLKNPVKIFFSLCGFVMVGLTFFAHNYSVLRAFFEYARDRIRIALGKSYAAFPSSQVHTLKGTFFDGAKLILKYYQKNPLVPILSVVFFVNGLRMLSWIDTFVPAVVLPAFSQILYALAVPILTPQFFAKPSFRRKRKSR